ncbi:MAG: hypothetical protein N3I35_14065 [Clostridia bacterium]|nr:hypothetical protein [Clostridia bacterium]
MRLTGRIVKDRITLKEAVVESKDDSLSYRDALEYCLIHLCRELDIQVPMWLRNNTAEFVNYRRAIFTEEHFVEKINFDKFEIKVM